MVGDEFEGNSLASPRLVRLGRKNLKYMLYKIYILKSKLKEKYYIGHTSDLDKRLHCHNAGKVRSTKIYKPWEIIYTEELKDKKGAYRREMQIKSYKEGEAFKKMIGKK